MERLGDRRASLAATREQQQINEVADRSDEGRDIGQRRGIEHAIDPGRFRPRRDHPHFLENDLRTPRCIELHRQGDQLKDRERQIDDNAEFDEPGQSEEETAEDDEGQEFEANIVIGTRAMPRFQRRVRRAC